VQAELQSRAALGRQSPLHGGHAVRQLKEPQLAPLALHQGQLPKSVGILAMPDLLGRLAQLPGVLLGGDLQELALTSNQRQTLLDKADSCIAIRLSTIIKHLF
jgi:hypothetical protein